MRKLISSFIIIAISAVAAQAAALLSLTGKVTDSTGAPVAGVPVTDGSQFVVTDAKGKYQLQSPADTKFVYITLPDGFEVPMQNGVPALYAEVSPDAKGRFQHHFTLRRSEADMSGYILFVQADPQVYFDTNLDEVKDASLEMKELLANEYPGLQAVGLVLGDVVGQISQGEKYFPWMIDNIAATGFPFFYVCGNHDIDTGVAVNEQSRQSFHKYFGPDYYSFNRGGVHYVVLNDVFWMGRYYAGYLPQKQLDWLKADLANVPEGTTVVLSMHIPCYSPAARDKDWGKESYHKVLGNRQELFKILKPYDAHIMTGHEHYNENYILAPNLYEHNHAPLSNLFWCSKWSWDGTPGGYAVYEVKDGRIVDWFYKSLGAPRHYQMNLYNKGVSREHPEAVVANIWNADSTWKIEWFENGKPMGEMIRYTGYDPSIWNDVVTNGKNYAFPYIGAMPTSHMFYAVPEFNDSEIMVRATDHNGTVYEAILKQSPQ